MQHRVRNDAMNKATITITATKKCKKQWTDRAAVL